MTSEEEIVSRQLQRASKQGLVLRVSDLDFEREVLERLARVEAKLEMLVGGPQPGRMKLVEDRVRALEKSDIRRSVLDRLMSAAIATLISAAIALHDHLGLK